MLEKYEELILDFLKVYKQQYSFTKPIWRQHDAERYVEYGPFPALMALVVLALLY